MTADTERVDVDHVAATQPPAAACPTTDREFELRNAPERGDVATIYTLIADWTDLNPSNCAANDAHHHAAWMGQPAPAMSTPTTSTTLESRGCETIAGTGERFSGWNRESRRKEVGYARVGWAFASRLTRTTNPTESSERLHATRSSLVKCGQTLDQVHRIPQTKMKDEL